MKVLDKAMLDMPARIDDVAYLPMTATAIPARERPALPLQKALRASALKTRRLAT